MADVSTPNLNLLFFLATIKILDTIIFDVCNELMKAYLDLLRNVMNNGVQRGDRTGTGTKSIFGCQIRFNLEDGFPLVTTKKVHLKSIIHELLWFIAGDTNVKYLQDNGVKIWNEWADENGDLGPVYGHQWRNFGTNRIFTFVDQRSENDNGVDQMERLIDGLKKNPNSRRHIMSAWNPVDIDRMALPPCHVLTQFYVHEGKLSCQLYQRSADLLLGVPFNIASYALLLTMIAQVCNLKPHEFIHTFGDAHIYSNHVDQVNLQLSRETRELPTMTVNPDVKSIFDFKYEDFKLTNYKPHPRIRAPIAV